MTHKMTKYALRGTRSLFFVQIFSTLSFSVLYSTLVLYTTKGLHITPSLSIAITGSFVSFNFFLHLLGGYIGGRFLSYRLLFGIGMLFQAAGCAILSLFTILSLHWGLAAFLTGCGLNVTCINCMLTQLFAPHDKRRETAFLWNYSGMNIGFFIGFTMSGFFQLTFSYSLLFLIAGMSNLIALVIVLWNWNVLADLHTHLIHKSSKNRFILGIAGIIFIFLLSLALRWLLTHSEFSNEFIIIVGILMFFVIALMAMSQNNKEAAKKMWAYLILAFSSLIFWTLYQMAPMGLTLFISTNVDRHILGIFVPPQWLLNINTIIIIIGAPVMAYIYQVLRKKGYTIRIPVQFTLALFLIGIAFAILPIGIHFADKNGISSFQWVVISYLLQSIGELFISPIGYAMVGQLITHKLQGLMMGTWLMTTGVAATLSNYFSRLGFKAKDLTHPLETNPFFSETFNILGWSAIIAGFILLLLIPFLKKLIQEKPSIEQIEPHPYNAPEETPS